MASAEAAANGADDWPAKTAFAFLLFTAKWAAVASDL